MPNLDPISTQRRIPDVEDYIDILRRHKAWIMGPLLAGIVIGVVTAFLWPDTFVSSSVVRVVPPQVPERFVPTNVNTQISERFNAMAAQILSRNTLGNIITTYNLYPDARNAKPLDDVIEEMRADIDIRNVTPVAAAARRNSAAFQVSFKYRNRFLAQKVTQELVTRFIDENIRSRSSQATQTTDFLTDKVLQAKKELDDIDRRITEFRLRNIGQTPDQKTLNVQQLNAAEFRLATLNSAVSRVNQEKMALEIELRNLNEKVRVISVVPTPAQAAAQARERSTPFDRDILQLETHLAALRERYKDTHPEVKRTQTNLAVLRSRRDAALERLEQANAPATDAGGQNPPPAISGTVARELVDLQAQIARIQGRVQAKDAQLEELANEMTALDRASKQYQARIESSPVNEQQYLQLMMEREAASNRYEDLRTKMSASEIATDLENRRQGEVLELLDPASLPQTPSEPARPLIIGAGAIAGLAFGIMLIAARELKDTSLKNLKDVRAYTQLTILGSVPLLENDLVVRRRRRLTWVGWSIACMLSIIVMAAALYYYHFIARV